MNQTISFLSRFILTGIVCISLSVPSFATSQRFASAYQSVTQQRQGIAQLVAHLQTTKLAKDKPLTESQRQQLQSTWSSMRDYIIALENTVNQNSDFYRQDKALRAQQFYLHMAAFVTSYHHALMFIEQVELNPAMVIALQEIETTNSSYQAFKNHYLNPKIASRFGLLQGLLKTASSKPPMALKTAIDQDSDGIYQYGRRKGLLLTGKNALSSLGDLGFDAWLPVQKGVAQWMGDTKVWRHDQALISHQQIAQLPKQLQPGDILLQRREWYLTNVGIPGFWPHAALYIGDVSQRQQYFNDADVKQWLTQQNFTDLEALLKQQHGNNYALSLKLENQHPRRVIEAIAQGVSFTSLEHSAAADSMAVLRPRLSKLEVAKAISRAFSQAGKPYDYNFDFLTDNALVCSELIYKSYQPSQYQTGLQLPLKTIAGRAIMPANEIARLYSLNIGSAAQQMDLVLFLDGDEKTKSARVSNEAEFLRSWQRPKWHIVKQLR